MTSYYTSSSIPPNPSLRSSTLNAVAVVPLLSSSSSSSSYLEHENETTTICTHSLHSFHTLFACLTDVNLERESSGTSTNSNDGTATTSGPSGPNTPNEITLIVPNSNLTPPSEFKYDSTPLKSHNWTIGCQRLLFLNGLSSPQAHDRTTNFSTSNTNTTSSTTKPTKHKKSKKATSHYANFVDLYPSRGVSAIIGVLNIKDCKSEIDIQRAYDELDVYADKFTPHLYHEKSFLSGGKYTKPNSPMSPKHFVVKRLFLFDSFEESVRDKFDLSSFYNYDTINNGNNDGVNNLSELIAFPPLENIDLHLNVVVNDLAVAMFMNLEKRIKVMDSLRDFDSTSSTVIFQNHGNSKKNMFQQQQQQQQQGQGQGQERSDIGTVMDLSFGSTDDDDDKEGNNNNNGQNANDPNNTSSSSFDIYDNNMNNMNMMDDSNLDILKTHSTDDPFYVSQNPRSPTPTTQTPSNTNTNNSNSNSKRSSPTASLNTSTHTAASTNAASNALTTNLNNRKVTLPGLGRLAAYTVSKALNKQTNNNSSLSSSYYTNSNSNNNNNNNNRYNSNDSEYKLPPIEHELQTPLDIALIDEETDNNTSSSLTSKDIQYLAKRNEARREKYTADLALMAGSVMDAYDRYNSAANKLKQVHDPLWYAAAIEGIATTFVAMSDTGGHGADLYLERNFQLPEKVMESAWVMQQKGSGSSGGGGHGHAGDDENGGEEIEIKIDRKKKTMPEVVCALLEEACMIMSKNIKLSSIYAELLLKFAWYISELEAVHVLCRWGEGFSGGDGQDDATGMTMTSAISGQQKRWKLTSVSKIDLDSLYKAGKLDALLSENSVKQCQKFTKVLHLASSNGWLDALTRANVAARCAKLCLKGVRVPQWHSDETKIGPHNKQYCKSFKRCTLPRKAAYFALVAAESMAQCKIVDAPKRAAGFWAAASHLYSNEGNKFDGSSSYAWACLRAAVLHAVSQHGGSISSEYATEELLLLLGEISPRCNIKNTKQKDNNRENDTTREFKAVPKTPKPEAITRGKSTQTASLFGQTNSKILMKQSQWVNNDPVPMLMMPLIEPSSFAALAKGDFGEIKLLKKSSKNYRLLPSTLCLDCVITDMKFDICTSAQNACISYLSKLRTVLPISTYDAVGRNNHDVSLQLQQLAQSDNIPLEVISAKIIKSESHLLMDKLKAAGFVGKATTSMSTFFNPYAKKKKESLGRNIITLVAQGEERTIVVEFGNDLTVPLAVPSCQLFFEKSANIDIEAPSLSFIIPPKTKGFIVNFPFIIVSVKDFSDNDNGSHIPTADVTAEETNSNAHSFTITGLRIAIYNRTLLILFPVDCNSDRDNSNDINYKKVSYSNSKQVPDPLSVYQRRTEKRQEEKKQSNVSLEAVPSQPNLLVSFATAATPLEDAATVPVHLSDGEIYTIPPFRLENDVGLGDGVMERLQIVGVGLPGLPEEVLFDTDEMAKALEEEEDRFSETDSEAPSAFDELMESDGLPPLKMKCSADGLSLKSINDKSKSLGEGSIVTFQVAATHDMGDQLKNGGNVRIRFRYRGPSPFPGVEIWRKREISLQIVRVKGLRISSLTFRSDLSWGSEFTDLCRSLSLQRFQLEQVPNWEASKFMKKKSPDKLLDLPSELLIESSEGKTDADDAILHSVGQNTGVFVSKDDVIVLMAVANETNSTIILSNRSGVVGGFESSPMPTVRVTSGVSVKIPVVIPRIDCLDENGKVIDIAAELIARTALQWEEVTDAGDQAGKSKRQGRVRIPSRCLREMIESHESFVPRICKPPVIINLTFGGEQSHGVVDTYPGCTVDAKIHVRIQDWVPAGVLSTCNLTLEFACARKDSGKSVKLFKSENQGAFIWCGQVRKSVQISDDNISHFARICFLSPGEFVVSACVKICHMSSGSEETWWAPFSKRIKVQKFLN